MLRVLSLHFPSHFLPVSVSLFSGDEKFLLVAEVEGTESGQTLLVVVNCSISAYRNYDTQATVNFSSIAKQPPKDMLCAIAELESGRQTLATQYNKNSKDCTMGIMHISSKTAKWLGTSVSKSLPENKYYPLISADKAKAANASAIDAILCQQGTLDPKKVKTWEFTIIFKLSWYCLFFFSCCCAISVMEDWYEAFERMSFYGIASNLVVYLTMTTISILEKRICSSSSACSKVVNAWDMTTEISVSQLQTLVEDPNAKFQLENLLTMVAHLWTNHASDTDPSITNIR
ncbi:unnamed protein product [Fraxinus pennsylvanica]|uniref:Uncharacterized protein n=1 Tax=Fraxinus pennsylvanica TaxID=56036 RepID=A0AAD1ZBS0_9LAMI|nr:unnamed protein product [Fraxinus pennsylvanica]